MSLRAAILATLLLGDQYGLQLHGEIVSRTARTAPLNVGQVYATLDRLLQAGQVVEAGTSVDGLRLYRLTAIGRRSAESWLVTPALPVDWASMREQLLLVSTIPGASALPLVTAYSREWAQRRIAAASGDDLGAEDVLAAAAETWLASFDDLSARRRPLAKTRFRRGRRPAA